MSKEIVEKYKTLVEFLGEILGANYEVVFHLITEKDSYVAAIANGHLSGRTMNAPLTDLALQFIKDKVYLKQNYVAHYKCITSTNKILRGSTFFVKKENKLIGMLCINCNVSQYLDISKQILSLVNIDNTNDSIEKNIYKNNEIITENFTNSIQETIYSLIDPVLLQPHVQLKQEQKVDIIEQLHLKGIFRIKGAIVEVAQLLNTSEPSIYRYIKMVEKKHKLLN